MINDATKTLLDEMCYNADEEVQVMCAVEYLHDCLSQSGATDIPTESTMANYVMRDWQP